MTQPPRWGWRPRKVDDPLAYQDQPPPQLSDRCEYWMRRLAEGSWRPGPDDKNDDLYAVGHLGVYLWEWNNMIKRGDEALAPQDLLDRQASDAYGAAWAAASREHRAHKDQSARHRQALVTAILNHGGYHCQDPACILECVQDAEDRR